MSVPRSRVVTRSACREHGEHAEEPPLEAPEHRGTKSLRLAGYRHSAGMAWGGGSASNQGQVGNRQQAQLASKTRPDPFDSCFQSGKAIGADPPEDVRLHHAVVVAQDVPDPGDLAPGDIRFRCLRGVREPAACLGDDFEIALDQLRARRSAANRSKSSPAVSASMLAIA
jgi:hypothetical protein